MSLKHLLGLNEAGIPDAEIMKKLRQAQDHDLEGVDFVRPDGTVVKVHLPHVPLDPILFQDH